MPVLSVDLACKSVWDIGVAILEPRRAGTSTEFVEFGEPGQTGPPSPSEVAERCLHLCAQYGASILLLDGPQGWKDPDNGCEHSRVCERLLNAPAKTGLPGYVKPKGYTAFVEFSVA